MAKLSKKMEELLNAPMEELMARTRQKSNDFGALSDEEKAILHRKVAVNVKVAKDFKNGAEEAQFFNIDDNPKEHTMSPVFRRGQKVAFTKTKDGQTEQHTLPILGFKQSGSRAKVTYNYEGKEITFVPAGMSVETKVGAVALKNVTIVE